MAPKTMLRDSTWRMKPGSTGTERASGEPTIQAMSAKLSLSGVLRREAIMAHTCSSSTAGGMRCRKSARLCRSSDCPRALAPS